MTYDAFTPDPQHTAPPPGLVPPQPTFGHPPAGWQPWPPPPAKKRAVWPWIAAGSAAAVAVLTVASLAMAGAFSQDPFTDVQSACDSAHTGTRIADGGDTFVIDGQGKEDVFGLDTAGVLCALDGLKMTTAVREHVSSTRALDGRQEDAWDGLKASWTYHPDNGLQMTVTKA